MSRFFKLRPSPISRKVLFTSAITKAVTSKPLLAFVQVSFAKHFAFLALLLCGFQLKVDDLGFPDVTQKLRDILCTRPQNNFHHPVAGHKQVMALRYSLTTVFAQRHTSLSVCINRCATVLQLSLHKGTLPCLYASTVCLPFLAHSPKLAAEVTNHLLQ